MDPDLARQFHAARGYTAREDRDGEPYLVSRPMTRHVVTMTSGDTTLTYDGNTTDAIAAILACVRMAGPAPSGIYEVEVGIYGRKPSAGRVGVRADGSLTIGTRWNLQTPVEPIDRADLGIDVGVMIAVDLFAGAGG